MAKFIEVKDVNHMTMSINIDHIILFRPFGFQGELTTQFFLTGTTYSDNDKVEWLIARQNYPTVKKAISDAFK